MEPPTVRESTKALNRDRWYFKPEVLANSPSIQAGMTPEAELSNRQQAANMIQDMGQRLRVSQLCINTAIVYMHRFYVFHSFKKFHRTDIAVCALFLAAKVEEQPRKMEYVISIAQTCMQRTTPTAAPAKGIIADESARLIKNENIMLQTLGFDIAIEHPHTFVVKTCELVRASKDLAQTCYFMATNSLHLTTLCLQQRPTVVACVCIHLACKWSSFEIPKSSEGKDWFSYVDDKVTLETLEQLTAHFLSILDKCPTRLKRKIMAGGGQGSGSDNVSNMAPGDGPSKTSHSSTPPPTRHVKMEDPSSRYPPSTKHSSSSSTGLVSGSSWNSLASQQQRRHDESRLPISVPTIKTQSSPHTPPLPSSSSTSWSQSVPSSSSRQHPNSRNSGHTSTHSNNSSTSSLTPVKVEPTQPQVQSREKHSLDDYRAKKEQERKSQEVVRDLDRQEKKEAERLKLLEEERRRDQEKRQQLQEQERIKLLEEEKRKEQAKLKAIEDERMKREIERKLQEEEDRRRQEEAKRKAEEAERLRLQQEEKERLEQEESRRIAQEALQRMEEEEAERLRLQEEIQRNLQPIIPPESSAPLVTDHVKTNSSDNHSSDRHHREKHKDKKKKKHKNKEKDRDKDGHRSHKSHKKDRKDKRHDKETSSHRKDSEDHLQSLSSVNHSESSSLKLKIPLSKISSDNPTKLKIVINKDRLSSTSPSSSSTSPASDYLHHGHSRKRKNSADYGTTNCTVNKKPVV